MTEDLNMTGDDYNVALFTFFITYILFEVRYPIPVFESLLFAESTLFSRLEPAGTTLQPCRSWKMPCDLNIAD